MTKPCNCIAEVNKTLAQHNTMLVFTLFGTPSRVIVDTTQVETGRGKKKAAAMIATFCPFCGERYEPEPARPATSADLTAMLDDPTVAAAVNEQAGGRAA
ncbi:hypothetical protein [Sphingobium yanoikuyae]|uniref:hypothetical protein n=1 Tax=Sphingobium yanoikuyae TaxID=13690 RepID=UPI0028AEF9F1|nr:hypothetical protein [Sphingobium yanoikuyae]